MLHAYHRHWRRDFRRAEKRVPQLFGGLGRGGVPGADFSLPGRGAAQVQDFAGANRWAESGGTGKPQRHPCGQILCQ